MTLFAVETIEESRQRKLFTLLEVDFLSTHRFRLNTPLMAIAGIAVAVIFSLTDQVGSQVLVGLGYGLLIMLSNFFHGLGHIIGSRKVNAPMTALIMTVTVGVTHFEDRVEQGSLVHVGRSLDGPTLNLAFGIVAIAIYLFTLDSHFLLFFGIVNLGFCVLISLPIPPLDGSVNLRELRYWR